ncbi:BrnA antitoxin family protein [Kerstersia gyiorum]|uniref:BrnA antitoxin family protein n=1 Tax=Kerstersia gyiorum TaxID=206506 RepID=UPI00214FDCB3|nr:BrnA antitoxin family protein [Kerstersia gyiorum]MCR4158827.1 BrnA antitoxin family protein [Kerstersia gyiorum]
MNKQPNPAMIDGDAPKWGAADFQNAKRLNRMPAEFQQAVRRLRGPQKAPTKVQTAIRYDADIAEAFKAGGPGWQTRMNNALREWLQEHRT